ncbi:MAG: DUF202 domain-containing protein [Desulfobulbaceae bacterium]|nr:DUF202 domain-containing protein [Desulfobulbaceae bacterium]
MFLRNLKKFSKLAELSERFGCPWLEYNEKINAPMLLLLRLDFGMLRKELWFPRSVADDRATVIACKPGPDLAGHIKDVLGVSEVDFFVTVPSDLIRIIEHNQDLNPDFPATAGRTPLARVRTYLAARRSLLAHYRTLLAKSRTGLAFIRTGISFVTTGLLFVRIFGMGYLLLIDVPLLIVGCVMTYDGFRWYFSSRDTPDQPSYWQETMATGANFLEVNLENPIPLFNRSDNAKGAADLRQEWTNLSPVMRRRYLANDRTDLAEERSMLSCYRTRMAKTRTGLAFVRTGVAFIGLGFGLVRHYHASGWMVLDIALILIGAWMAGEGFLSYSSGRRAGKEGYLVAQEQGGESNIWDFSFPHSHSAVSPMCHSLPLPVRGGQAAGIWGTTGLALERTVLAERRNVMGRLRTVMARSRTGFAFVRTGFSILMVGIAFVVYFRDGGFGWGLFETLMLIGGLALIGDGIYLSFSAEKYRRQFPYCSGDMEIGVPNYGKPVRLWQKVVFSNASS